MSSDNIQGSTQGNSQGSVEDIVKKDSIIFRPVTIDRKNPAKIDIRFASLSIDKTDRGNFSCKIDTRYDHGEWLPRNCYELINHTRCEVVRDNGKKRSINKPNSGIVLFIDVEPAAQDWTGVIITATTPTVAFGTPLKLCSIDEYLDFRVEMYKIFSRYPSMEKAESEASDFYRRFLLHNETAMTNAVANSLRRFKQSRQEVHKKQKS